MSGVLAWIFVSWLAANALFVLVLVSGGWLSGVRRVVLERRIVDLLVSEEYSQQEFDSLMAERVRLG